MFIIDPEAATQKIESLDKSTIIFNNKLFTRGFDIFPNAYKKAFQFCIGKKNEEYSPVYLLVEHPHYITIWIEQEEVSVTDDVFTSPINSDQPKSTDSLLLKAPRYQGKSPRHLDGEESRNHNQFPTPVLSDLVPKDVSVSEASIVTQNAAYWYNPTESDSPQNPKVPTGNLNQQQEIPESEFQVHPQCQQITEESLKRLSKKKYRGIYYQEQDILIQLPESELSLNSQVLDQKESKKTYRGVPY
ncbi:hypothetical protein [Moorena sp. SIO3H5]|uniref:hypothetical protein n=1 Tax=Moorena sp. SIO3H5 TaxID=2607834 RepID=UPI0013BB0041|nr:hypothetical protein [Moorena sp. SIO3H5]NEO69069.1 hypothetical protein [Moorena sp. SIO3H5]